MDYSKYKMSFKEKALVIIVSIFATFVIAYLFYDSMWGIIFAPLFIAILSRLYRNSKIKEQKDRLTREFIDFLKNVSTALIAGYSIENAKSVLDTLNIQYEITGSGIISSQSVPAGELIDKGTIINLELKSEVKD